MSGSLVCRAVAVLISFLLFGHAAPMQEQTRDSVHKPRCPTISVDCPTGAWHYGDPVEFKAYVTDVPADSSLTYKWEVSKGRIVAGQGTATIKVDLRGEKNDSILATVEVSGAGEECDSKASCASSVGLRQKKRTE